MGGLALAALSLLGSACTSATTASPTTTTIPIPPGWKTYTYGKAAIAVPSSWAVKHDTNCPNAPAPGTLLLGLPKVPTNCAEFQTPMSVVTVSQLSTDTGTTSVPIGEMPVAVNGVPVYVGFGSPTFFQWTVPSLDVQISGTGPDANQVMHTLHKV